MRAYSLKELFCLTRNELFALHHEICSEIATLADDAPERATANEVLRRIRRVLAQIRPGP